MDPKREPKLFVVFLSLLLQIQVIKNASLISNFKWNSHYLNLGFFWNNFFVTTFIWTDSENSVHFAKKSANTIWCKIVKNVKWNSLWKPGVNFVEKFVLRNDVVVVKVTFVWVFFAVQVFVFLLKNIAEAYLLWNKQSIKWSKEYSQSLK